MCREVRIGQAGRAGRALGGEKLMGTATYGGKGFKQRTRVNGKRPIGAACFKQQYIQTSFPSTHTHTHTHSPGRRTVCMGPKKRCLSRRWSLDTVIRCLDTHTWWCATTSDCVVMKQSPLTGGGLLDGDTAGF